VVEAFVPPLKVYIKLLPNKSAICRLFYWDKIEMTQLQLFLFGSPRLERDGVIVTVDTRKAIALLSYLALTGQLHSRDTLATLFWPEYPQSQAKANLRRTLSTLAKAIGKRVFRN